MKYIHIILITVILLAINIQIVSTKNSNDISAELPDRASLMNRTLINRFPWGMNPNKIKGISKGFYNDYFLTKKFTNRNTLTKNENVYYITEDKKVYHYYFNKSKKLFKVIEEDISDEDNTGGLILFFEESQMGPVSIKYQLSEEEFVQCWEIGQTFIEHNMGFNSYYNVFYDRKYMNKKKYLNNLRQNKIFKVIETNDSVIIINKNIKSKLQLLED